VRILDELRELGPCSILAHTDAVPSLDESDPEVCYTYWDILLTTQKGLNAVQDVFIFVDDAVELRIEPIDAEENWDKKIGEIMVERGDVAPEALAKVLSERKRIGEDLIEKGLVLPEKVEAALAEQEHVREIHKERQNAEASASIRVAASRLDVLVNLVGELVTVQSRLTQTAASLHDAGLLLVAEEVERLTGELRDNTMSIRMLPIGSTFSKFKRLVRDLSAELGKEIVFLTEGAETELDKNMIEKLNDPLVHLIRNCVDHGIERPEARTAAGKPTRGVVRLTAEHSGASVLIRIEDDGSGLDAEAIRAKALEKRLISPETALAEKDLFSMIFAPGFSTAKAVPNISGLGVGMDEVKRSIDALRGTIEIASQRGRGPRSPSDCL
jgi:two-component system chemotaxis sensor kinase CheA